MKKIFLKIMMIAFIGAVTYSCQESDRDPVLSSSALSKVSTKNDLSGSYVITESNLKTPFHTFVINRADYGVPIAINYNFEVAKADTDFSPSAKVGDEFTSEYASFTYEQLNNTLADMGLDAGEAHNLELRIVGTPIEGRGVNALQKTYSDVYKITVTPYKPDYDKIFPKINIPGNYDTSALGGYAQWTPNNAPNLYSYGKNDVYTGFQYMPISGYNGFKFTIKEDWAGDKGDDGTKSGKLVESGEKDIESPTFPTYDTYYFKVDWANNTYSMQKANMGLIGEATPGGWDNQTDLTYNPVTKKFELASVAMKSGKLFKFRNDGGWGIKIQPKSADVNVAPSKEVQIFCNLENVTGDPNFVFGGADGNYKLEVDLHNSGYYNMKFTKL